MTDIETERQKKKREARSRRNDDEDKFSQSELFCQIVLKMNRDRFAARKLPDFPRRFHLIEGASGSKAVLEELAHQVVAYRVVDVVTEAIVRYCWEDLSMVAGADISYRSAQACRELWRSLTIPLSPPPLALAEASYVGYAFRKLAFDAPVERDEFGELTWPAEPPHFASFLRRCSAPQQLCAFVGSLFYPEADRQQYLYLHGEGQDGKGSLLRMLYHLIGDAAQSLQPKSRDDRFWNMKVFGKRLVMFPDCEDYKFFSSAEFKSITGNDPVYFEEKGKSGFTAIPTCKFMVASNHAPNITSQKSDLRRLVYCRVAEVSDSDRVGHFDRLLLAEAEQIVRLCKTTYEHLCLPDHGAIPADSANEVADDAEELAIGTFYRHFEQTTQDVGVESSVVFGIMKSECGGNSREFKKYVQIWGRQLGVVYHRAGKRRRYLGMKLRPFRVDGDGRTGS